MIAGLGLIGGSAAKALKNKGYRAVYAYDQCQMTIDSAKKDGVIEDGYTQLSGKIEKFDFILCCLSPIFVVPLYKSAAPYLKDGGVFAEMGGIKTVMIKELEEAMMPHHELLPLHPMAGSEKTGYVFSDKSMFEGSVLVMTPGQKTEEKAYAWANVLRSTLGFKELRELSPWEHDKIIAKVSHIPHIVALAVKAMNNGSNNEIYAGGSYKSTTRVAEINSALWAGLMKDNKEYLLDAITELQDKIDELKRAIENSNYEQLEKLINNMSGQE